MKAKDLAELLMKNPDFDVEACFCDVSKVSFDHPYVEYNYFPVEGISDIGYSDKVIILDCR